MNVSVLASPGANTIYTCTGRPITAISVVLEILAVTAGEFMP